MKKILKAILFIILMAPLAYGQQDGVKFGKVQIRNWLELSSTKLDTNLYHTYIGVVNGILRVNGLVLQNDTHAIPGMIRFSGSHFYGYTGSDWAQLDGASGGGGGGGGGGATSFLGLSDTPSSYSGYANYLMGVSSTEDFLTFVNPANINANAIKLQGRGITAIAPQAGDFLRFDGTQWGLKSENNIQANAVKIQGYDIIGNPVSGQVLGFNGTEATWVNQTGSGAANFTDLNDTPSSYSGNASKVTIVNSGETGLTFVAQNSLSTNAVKIQGYDVIGTPTSGQVLSYNGTEIAWANQTGSGASKFTDLTDTPSDYSNGYLLMSGSSSINYALPDNLVTKAGWIRNKPISLLAPTDGYVLKYDAASDSVKWEADNTGSGTGATTFIGLDDTPTSYSGYAGRLLKVNSSENGIGFETAALNDLSNVNTTPASGDLLEYNGTNWINIAQSNLSANATKLQGESISSVTPSSGQVLKFDGSYWSPATDETGPSSLTGLNDTPSGYGANYNYVLATNQATNGTEWKAFPSDTSVIWAAKYADPLDAINAAYTTRKPVVFAGKYNLNGNSIEIPKDSVDVIFDGFYVYNTGTRTTAIYITGSHVKLSGSLVIEAGDSYSIDRGIYVSGGQFEQINATAQIRNTYGAGLYLYNAKDSFISNIQFLNCGRDGATSTVIVYTSDNCHLSNLYSIWGQGANHGDFYFIQSDNCDVINSKVSGPQGSGLEVTTNTYGFRWIGGEIGGAHKHGVLLTSNTRYSSIVGAVIHMGSYGSAGTYDNIRLDKVNNITISNCKIFSQHDAEGDPSTWTKWTKNGIDAIDTCQYINITNNSIDGHTTDGILIDTGSKYIEIMNNEISNNSTGVQLGAGSSYCHLVENRFHGNSTDANNNGTNNKTNDIAFKGDAVSSFSNNVHYIKYGESNSVTHTMITSAAVYPYQMNINDNINMNYYKVTSLGDPTADNDAANKKYVDNAIANTNLSDLNDVSTTTPSTNQVLTWDGSTWSPAFTSTSELGGKPVSTATPQDGQILIYDATKDSLVWSNVIRPSKDITMLADASRTADGTSSEFDVSDYGEANIYLNVVSANSGALTVYVQSKDPVSGEWFTIGQFPRYTAAGGEVLWFKGGLGNTLRIKYTLEGGTYEFSVGASVKPMF